MAEPGKGYHDFVFDVPNRRLVGDFEGMYRAELEQGFDAWHERDLRPLRKRLALEMLADFNFGRILEIGCGKGAFTQFLKKRNNEVVAVDLSQTAIAQARQSYPDIDFRVMTVQEACRLDERFDLVLVMGTFAYVEGWEDCVAAFPRLADRCMLGEYIPPDPIGHVKSVDHLVETFARHYSVESKVVLDDHHCLVMGQSHSSRDGGRA